VFADERTLEIDHGATETLRATLRSNAVGRSLTEHFAGQELPPASAPTSVAGNAEFGLG